MHSNALPPIGSPHSPSGVRIFPFQLPIFPFQLPMSQFPIAHVQFPALCSGFTEERTIGWCCAKQGALRRGVPLVPPSWLQHPHDLHATTSISSIASLASTPFAGAGAGAGAGAEHVSRVCSLLHRRAVEAFVDVWHMHAPCGLHAAGEDIAHAECMRHYEHRFAARWIWRTPVPGMRLPYCPISHLLFL